MKNIFLSLCTITIILVSCNDAPDPVSKNSEIPERTQVIIEPIPLDKEIFPAWHQFKKAIRSKNYYQLNQFLFDSIQVCNKTYSIRLFKKECFEGLFDSSYTKSVKDSANTELLNKMVSSNYFSPGISRQLKIKSDTNNIIVIQVNKVGPNPDLSSVLILDFIKTPNGFKFFKANLYPDQTCCKE